MKNTAIIGFNDLNRLDKRIGIKLNHSYYEEERAERKLEKIKAGCQRWRYFKEIIDSILQGHSAEWRKDTRRPWGLFFFVNAKNNNRLLLKQLLEDPIDSYDPALLEKVGEWNETKQQACPFCKAPAYIVQQTLTSLSNWDDDDFTTVTSVICFSCEKAKKLSEVSE